jgi:hypothetical protein
MKNQVPELTFQIGIIHDVCARVAVLKPEVSGLLKSAPATFPIQLSLNSASGLLDEAYTLLERAEKIAVDALTTANLVLSSPDGKVDGNVIPEPQVAARGVVAITMKQSAEALLIHAEYHLKRARHLIGQQAAPKAS